MRNTLSGGSTFIKYSYFDRHFVAYLRRIVKKMSIILTMSVCMSGCTLTQKKVDSAKMNK